MFDLFVKNFGFIASAIIAATALFFVTTYLQPFLRKKEKAGMALAELANATRHFERSVDNLESFLMHKKGRRLGRVVDYQKCKYSATGFVGLAYADFIGLPDKITRDLMQIGLVYRNTNLEADNVVEIVCSHTMSDDERDKKFDAMSDLIKRMKNIISMTDMLSDNVRRYHDTTFFQYIRDEFANNEIDWPDDFYKQGKTLQMIESQNSKVDRTS